jgi:hypothetical protein
LSSSFFRNLMFIYRRSTLRTCQFD